ncbi:MAG: hypothetical protein RIR11_2538 [Bacteroidota bacterium]|jgi:hypothetical protein
MENTPPNYPQVIEHSSASIVIALSDTEIGKIQLPSTLVFVDVHTGEPVNLVEDGGGPTIQKETMALIQANLINDLMPKFIRLQPWQLDDGTTHEMLVMERLLPLPIHHFEYSVRLEMLKRFEQQIEELHQNNFVHGDFQRPTTVFNRGDQKWMYKNIVQTEQGLRLLDAGFGTKLDKDNIKLFVSILIRERDEVKYFRSYYIGSSTEKNMNTSLP